MATSQVLSGEDSLLAFFPQFQGLKTGLDRVKELSDEHTVSVLLPAGTSFIAESRKIAQRIGSLHVRIL